MTAKFTENGESIGEGNCLGPVQRRPAFLDWEADGGKNNSDEGKISSEQIGQCDGRIEYQKRRKALFNPGTTITSFINERYEYWDKGLTAAWEFNNHPRLKNAEGLVCQ